MENVEHQEPSRTAMTAGSELREAREAAGLSRSDIAMQTKIAERHLLAIEEDRLGDLAARTYAVGFARAYARALGMDERAIAEKVHRQLDSVVVERPAATPSFEPGDPARVPPMRLAWLAGGGAVVVIALLLVFWSSFLSPEGKLPDLLAPASVAVAPAPGTQAAPASAPVTPAPPPQGAPVVLTATADHVWIKVTDASGAQLLQKELAKGESWTVPGEAQGPQLRTGRPDALQITVGGKPVPALSDKAVTMGGISLVSADMQARANPAPVPVAAQRGAAERPPVSPGPLAGRGGSKGAAAPGASPRVEPSANPAAPANNGAASAPVAATPLPSQAAAPISTDSE